MYNQELSKRNSFLILFSSYQLINIEINVINHSLMYLPHRIKHGYYCQLVMIKKVLQDR